jgi:hypothetical protein
MGKLVRTMDRRIDPRLPTKLAGTIRFRDTTLTCVVKERSRLGARLQLTTSRGVPDAFDLAIGVEPGVLRACVVWRTANEIGVRLNAATPGFGRRPAAR